MPKGPKKHFKGLRRASPTLAKRFDPGTPIAKIDTRPMAILAVIIVTVATLMVRVPQHAVVVEFWPDEGSHPFTAESYDRSALSSEIVNRLTLSFIGEILWNGHPITSRELVTLLQEVQSADTQSIVEFEPDANASYEFSAKVLWILRASGAQFRIAGMEKYCQFDNGDNGFASSGQVSSLNLAHSIAILDPEGLNAWRDREPCEPLQASHRPPPAGLPPCHPSWRSPPPRSSP